MENKTKIITRANVVKLKPTSQQKKILDKLMLYSSIVYNKANKILKYEFENREKLDSFFTLRDKLQADNDYQYMGRSYASSMVKKVHEQLCTYFKIIEKNPDHHVSFPKMYYDKFGNIVPSYLVMDSDVFHIDRRHVKLPISDVMRKEMHDGKRFYVKYNGVLRYKGKQARSEIFKKNGKYYLAQAVDIKPTREFREGGYMGVDLGVKRGMAVVIKKGKRILIGDENDFQGFKKWQDKIDEEKSRVNKKGIFKSKQLTRLYGKQNNYMNNLLSNYVSKLIKFAIENKVRHIIVGKPKLNREKVTPYMKTSNMMTRLYFRSGQMITRITNKAEEYGIEVLDVDEKYTSITCPKCKHFSRDNIDKKDDRIFRCVECEFEDDRDYVGAYNILCSVVGY